MGLSNKIIGNILGTKKIRTDKKSWNQEKAIPGKKCYNCGKTFKLNDDWYYYYHGDQDDRVCENCAKKLTHSDTAYSGFNVFKTGG